MALKQDIHLVCNWDLLVQEGVVAVVVVVVDVVVVVVQEHNSQVFEE